MNPLKCENNNESVAMEYMERKIRGKIYKGENEKWFVSLCSFFNELQNTRFKQKLLGRSQYNFLYILRYSNYYRPVCYHIIYKLVLLLYIIVITNITIITLITRKNALKTRFGSIKTRCRFDSRKKHHFIYAC